LLSSIGTWRKIADAFVRAGLKSPVLDNVRNEIWLELWGDLTFNAISALMHATLVDICQYLLVRNLAANMMPEALAVEQKIGTSFHVPLEQRFEGDNKFFDHVHCGSPGYIFALTAGVRWKQPPLLSTCP
jgi:2-dehydropantoate 2-reductase